MGDVFEVSSIRREDYEFHKGKSEYEDILQSNNLPSSATPRGHQAPAAFLIMASGLDKVQSRSSFTTIAVQLCSRLYYSKQGTLNWRCYRWTNSPSLPMCLPFLLPNPFVLGWFPKTVWCGLRQAPAVLPHRHRRLQWPLPRGANRSPRPRHGNPLYQTVIPLF